MRQILEYVKLTRPVNLLFVMFIEWAMLRGIVYPLLCTWEMEKYIMPSYILILLIVATVLIAAGGNVINDYFDIKIDRVNRPTKVIVSNTIEKKSAMRFYQVLTGMGLIVGLVVAFLLKSLSLGFVFFVIPGVLWFYSASYKRQILVGNLMVAFCAAMVPLVVMMAQNAWFSIECGDFLKQVKAMGYDDVLASINALTKSWGMWICGFAGFAFLFTFIREIIKDMQDIEGDCEVESRTMPIVWGEKVSKGIVIGLIVVTVALLGWVVYSWIPFEGNLTERYYLFGIVLPCAFLIYMVGAAKKHVDYKNASNLTKFIMLVGTLYSFVFLYLQMGSIAAN